jgi:hypothetical protein
MEEKRERIAALLRPLSQAQLDFQPDPNSWSIGQVAEHVALSERGLLDIVKSLLQGPAGRRVLEVSYDQLPLTIQGIPNSVARLSFELLSPFSFLTRFTPKSVVQFMLANRVLKAKAAPQSEPAHGKARADLLAFLSEVRQSTLRFLESVKNKDLSQFHWSHPILGYQDLYGILDLITSHDNRHIRQIEIVRNDPRFPA